MKNEILTIASKLQRLFKKDNKSSFGCYTSRWEKRVFERVIFLIYISEECFIFRAVYVNKNYNSNVSKANSQKHLGVL